MTARRNPPVLATRRSYQGGEVARHGSIEVGDGFGELIRLDD